MQKIELGKINKKREKMTVQTLACHCGCGGHLIPAAIHQWTTGGANRAIG